MKPEKAVKRFMGDEIICDCDDSTKLIAKSIREMEIKAKLRNPSWINAIKRQRNRFLININF